MYNESDNLSFSEQLQLSESQVIHSLNMQEIQAQQQGSFGVMQGDSTPKEQSVWSKFFPGLGGN
jgi:hypothetical protein